MSQPGGLNRPGRPPSPQELAPGMGIIFPLYVSPDTSSNAWDPLIALISLHQNVKWKIIVNPDNGPNGTLPLGNYTIAVPRLTKLPNVTLHGYVHTKQTVDGIFGKRNITDVANDIYDWTQWPDDARPTGLFIDECSNGFESPSDVDYYANLANYARGSGTIEGAKAKKLPGNFFTNIIFNPGGVMNGTDYFSHADQIVILENDWNKCTGGLVGYPDTSGRADPLLDAMSQAINTIPVPQAQKSIIIYNVPFDKNVIPSWGFLESMGSHATGGAIDSVFLSSNAPASDGSGGQYSNFPLNFSEFEQFIAGVVSDST